LLLTDCVVLLRTVAMVHKGMDESPGGLKDILGKFELAFLFCFILEAIVKFLATGARIFFSSKANRFDIFVILASVLGCKYSPCNHPTGACHV